MTSTEIIHIVQALRVAGVEYIKTPQIEIRLRGDVSSAVEQTNNNRVSGVRLTHVPQPETKKPPKGKKLKEPPSDASIPPVDDGIPHNVNEVRNMLRLSDEDLVDKIFPDYTQGAG